MSERSLTDEIHDLAEQVAGAPDIVADLGAEIAHQYLRRRAVILGKLNVDALVAGDERAIDEQHPQLVALREDLRDRLRSLLPLDLVDLRTDEERGQPR